MIWTTRKLVFIGCCEALGCKTDECDEYHESKKSNGLLQQNKCRLNFVVFSEDWGENTEENNLVSVLFWGKVSCKSLKQRDLLILVIFIVHEEMHTHKLYSTFI